MNGGAVAAATDCRIRGMEACDVERVAEIERGAFSTPWKPSTFRGLVDSAGATLRVAEVAPHGVVGYSVLWCALDQGELANIAVAEERRGVGLGAKLLEDAIEGARSAGVRILYLEVRQSNSLALSMYSRRGFIQVGLRKSYYDRPQEDALVLMKRLSPIGEGAE